MEGGVSRFPVDTFLSHSAKTFRRGILYCCLNFGYREGLDKREGGNQDIPSQKLCLTVPELSRRESFFVAIISGIAKVWITGGRGVSRFPIDSFLSHSAENLRRGILHCCIISG